MNSANPDDSVSDHTVPYMTAAIDLDDPFADMETNGLQMYVHHALSAPLSPDLLAEN